MFNFVKILPVGAELFPDDGRTHLIAAFRDFAKGF
jgi:hypothetical protein